jgi:ABC-type antimicrobial peptide transport system permease subunit
MRLPLAVSRSIFAPAQPDIYLPVTRSQYVTVIGRLARGADMKAAHQELAKIARQSLVGVYTQSYIDRAKLDILPLSKTVVGDVPQRVLLLIGVSGLVLLVACANVANLLIARIAARRRELSLRIALGASRGAIARLVLAETVLIVALSGATGLLLAWLSHHALFKIVVGHAPFGSTPFDLRVLVLTFVVALTACLACGLCALPGARQSHVLEGAKGVATHVGSALPKPRLRILLLATEIALTLVLVIGAGLLLTLLLVPVAYAKLEWLEESGANQRFKVWMARLRAAVRRPASERP